MIGYKDIGTSTPTVNEPISLSELTMTRYMQ